MKQPSAYSTFQGNIALFPQARTFPQFFQHNLIDDHRVIKVLYGAKASLRAFYFQLFKLAFEIEVDGMKDHSGPIESLEYTAVIRTMLERVSLKKKIMQSVVQKIKDFVNYIIDNPGISFQSQIQLDRSIDTSMLEFLQALLEIEGLFNPSIQEVFSTLSSMFKIGIGQYNNCYKFSQSDVFVYVQSASQLYLAYLDIGNDDSEEAEVDESQETQKQRSSPFTKKMEEEDQYMYGEKQKNRNEKNDTIMNIFGDMLCSSRHEGNSKTFGDSLYGPFASSPKEDRMITPQKDEKRENVSHDDSQVETYEFFQRERKFQKVKRVEEIQLKKINEESDQKQDGKTSSPPQHKDKEEEDIFYRPKNNAYSLPETKIKQPQFLSKRRKDPMDFQNDGQKGTFYKQFTDTRILNILPEPHRTKVKILKNRFIGVRSKGMVKQ